MAPAVDFECEALIDDRSRVILLECQMRERSKNVEFRKRCRRGAERAPCGRDGLSKVGENLLLQIEGSFAG